MIKFCREMHHACSLLIATIILFLIGTQLSGCSTAPGVANSPGQAAYTIEHVAPDGTICKASAASGREIDQVRITIGADCSLNVEADAMTGAEVQGQFLGVINGLLQKVPTP
jgi:hypothetical protein